MSTFYGGGQLSGVASLSLVSGSYTVPNGHYAEVNYLLRHSGGTGGHTARLTLNTVALAIVDANDKERIGQITLTSGTVISLFLSAGFSITAGYVGIKIYKNP